eukprot:752123-Hanusia_phi.AAC.4
MPCLLHLHQSRSPVVHHVAALAVLAAHAVRQHQILLQPEVRLEFTNATRPTSHSPCLEFAAAEFNSSLLSRLNQYQEKGGGAYQLHSYPFKLARIESPTTPFIISPSSLLHFCALLSFLLLPPVKIATIARGAAR